MTICSPFWMMKIDELKRPFIERPRRSCSLCPRLVAYRRKNRQKLPQHWNAPVPVWGEEDAPFLIIGLAPGLHGANRTGLPFTGDASGDLLLPVLRDVGLAQEQEGQLALNGCRITNAVACVPPKNAPIGSEISNCQPKLRLAINDHTKVIFCLGGTAHRAVLTALGVKRNMIPFAHGAEGKIAEYRLFSSYHPSRYNVNTGRITREMLTAIMRLAVKALDY